MSTHPSWNLEDCAAPSTASALALSSHLDQDRNCTHAAPGKQHACVKIQATEVTSMASHASWI